MSNRFSRVTTSLMFNMLRAIFAATLVTSIQQNAVAASGWVKGTVEFARTHDSAVYAGNNPTYPQGWLPPVSWFTLTGVTQAGGCALWNGRVVFVTHDQQELAFVLSALKNGNTLAVAYDDTILANGSCTALYITIRSPSAPDVN